MNTNDKNLITQLIARGKAGAVYDYLPDYWMEQSKIKIAAMGEKWVCHKDNFVKRLDVPLPLLSDARTSKILKGKK